MHGGYPLVFARVVILVFIPFLFPLLAGPTDNSALYGPLSGLFGSDTKKNYVLDRPQRK